MTFHWTGFDIDRRDHRVAFVAEQLKNKRKFRNFSFRFVSFLRREFVSFVVEFEKSVERRSPIRFDPNVREQIDVRSDFLPEVRRAKRKSTSNENLTSKHLRRVERICKAKCQKERRYFSKEFHRLQFARERLEEIFRCEKPFSFFSFVTH